MSEVLNGTELSRLLLRRGTTAGEVARMDMEALTRMVADRREIEVSPGSIDSAISDAEVARAILEYAQSEPDDWPVPPHPPMGRDARIRDIVRGLLLAGVIAVGLMSILVASLGGIVSWDWRHEQSPELCLGVLFLLLGLLTTAGCVAAAVRLLRSKA